MLRFPCAQCGQKIKVKPDRLGRRVTCPRCGVVQAVTAEAVGEASLQALNAYDDGDFGRLDGGEETIYLHQPPRRSAANVDASLSGVIEHVEQHFGPVKTVLHELAAQRMDIDVQHIPPGRDRPFNVLVTLGMSALAMAAPPPPEGRGFEYAELLIVLPADWPLTHEAFQRDEHHWPVRALLAAARTPHLAQSWLAPGHVVPHGDPPRPFAPDTEFQGSIILPPTLFGPEAQRSEMQPDKTIHFFAVVPIYCREMDLHRKRGPESLIKRLSAAGVNELLDPNRGNVARKRFKMF